MPETQIRSRFVAVQQCMEHEDCREHPMVGIRCFAKKEAPEVYPLDTFCNDPTHVTRQTQFPIVIEREIPPGAFAFVTGRPQVPCIFTALLIPPQVAERCIIRSVRVGPNMLSNGRVLGSMFASPMPPRFNQFASPGVDLTIEVENIDQEKALRFSATIMTIREELGRTAAGESIRGSQLPGQAELERTLGRMVIDRAMKPK